MQKHYSMVIKNKKIKRNHDIKLQRRNQTFKYFRRNKNRQKLGIPLNTWRMLNREKTQFWNYDKIKAPVNFSLIANTEEVLNFIGRLQNDYERHKKTFVKLYHVKTITDDAILLLLSNVLEFRNAKIQFNGNRPKEPKVDDILEESGFFRILYGDSSDSGYDKETDNYSIEGRKRMFTHATRSVDSELTEELIERSAESLWGERRRCRGIQRIFLELMQNTNNHASRNPGDKYWWVNVSKLKNPKRIGFSFIDYGMGIFTSLETKGQNSKFANWKNKIIQICNPQIHYEVLKQMMNGKFHKTVTGKAYRGKGIPGIYMVNGLTSGIGYCPARALRVNAPALCFCRVRMEISLYTR